MFLSIQQFIAHLHPVLVHLPVGIFFISCIFQWLPDSGQPVNNFKRVALWVGTTSALLSCISGLLLSGSGEYDEALVTSHQWMGISLFIFSLLLLAMEYRTVGRKWKQVSYVTLFVLLIITGHLGGSLTHGSDYLSEAWNATDNEKEANRRVIINIDSAAIYADLIQPILQQKCYGCHGKNKQKGGLRMDKEASLLKGGEDGIVLVAGDPVNSDLVKRLELPRNHDDHMPPKEKPQLNEQDIRLIHWWVESGAPFSKRVHELKRSPEVDRMLTTYVTQTKEAVAENVIPDIKIEKADPKDLEAVTELGAVVTPVAQNSNYLLMNLVNADNLTFTNSKAIASLDKQLLWLRAGNKSVTDSVLVHIGKCTRLRRLQLDHAGITDAGMKELAGLDSLQYLNLLGTPISGQGITVLKGLKNLRVIYAYQTNIRKEDLEGLKKIFPKTKIEIGGYEVPTLVSDTTEVKFDRD